MENLDVLFVFFQNFLEGLVVLLLLLGFFGALTRLLSGFGAFHLFAEFINPTLAVNEAHFIGKERMTRSTNIHFDSGLGGASGEGVPADAGNYRVVVPVRMDVLFHKSCDYIT